MARVIRVDDRYISRTRAAISKYVELRRLIDSFHDTMNRHGPRLGNARKQMVKFVCHCRKLEAQDPKGGRVKRAARRIVEECRRLLPEMDEVFGGHASLPVRPSLSPLQ